MEQGEKEEKTQSEGAPSDALVNVHDSEMLSPPRMKKGTLYQAKGAVVMRSNFL
jgi:hypothetical protein